MGFFFCRGCVRGTQYQGLVGLYPSSHSESVSHTVFAGLISLEVLHIVPGVLPVSIPEPLNPENASLMFVVTLSDQKVNYRLNRFTSRGRKGGDLARSQGPRPGRVPLWWLRGPSGVVPIYGAFTIVTINGEPTPVRLQETVWS